MAFRFERAESPLDTLHRVADEEVRGALALIQAPPADTTIHSLRKHTKRLRGVLRLYQPVLRGYRAENAALRDAARYLAPLRDAEVRLATFDLLAVPQATGLRPVLADALSAEQAPDARAAALAGMQAALAGVQARIPDWQLRRAAGDGFEVLEPGLLATLIQAQTRMVQAAEALRPVGAPFDGAAFHEWRKAVKHHLYQVRLLQPLWPKYLAPHIAAADALGEALGLHNDLDMLIAALRGADPDALVPLEQVVLARRHALARDCLHDGARLFAGPAKGMVTRWADWWQLWTRV